MVSDNISLRNSASNENLAQYMECVDANYIPYVHLKLATLLAAVTKITTIN